MEEIEKCDENNLNSEHELVRKLLQRCSDLKTTFTIHGKDLFFFLQLFIDFYRLTMNIYIFYLHYRYK